MWAAGGAVKQVVVDTEVVQKRPPLAFTHALD